ncbi:MAG TPA: pyridoxamine 5'-phosphate oxidase family protein [Rhizomicrobium sp.]|jgi:predicted pyridoxine 5'-phosphate oxidase superfamily flavin-nucleotide-binding protein|nr:pyridoxamine 5'-phosphate oxidase family protein [Rhizomicrobium sp.]
MRFFDYSSDVAFSPAVKAVQEKKGSRRGYRAMEERGGWRTAITPELAAYIGERNSAFLATASADGQPYVQHRGGPKGFIHVLDAHRLAFADFNGNRQYISEGNLSENDRAMLFLMDWRARSRVKLWGTAKMVVADEALLARLKPPADYPAKVEQVMIFTVSAWDTNCNQHIPILLGLEEVDQLLAERDARIATLEAELTKSR